MKINLLSKYKRLVYKTSMNIFSCSNYIDFLRENIDLHSKERGYQARLASAAGMHPSYLSRILHGSIHPTPDQTIGMCGFWRLNQEEAQYFLNLVQLARAGTPQLKSFLEAELNAAKEKNQELGARLTAHKLDDAPEHGYYSAWYYSAVHMLLTIPGFDTEQKISERLHLPIKLVQKVLLSLETWQITQKTKNRWVVLKSNVHLSQKNWLASIHHTNWRTKMAERIQHQDIEDLHYTGLHTLSFSDARKIKALLEDMLISVDRTIRPSTEQELCCLLIDWSKI